MNVKLDENLGLRAKESMQAAGHDVTTVAEQSLCSADDETVISVCQKEQRCLATLDLDFANPLAFVPSEYSGIAVLAKSGVRKSGVRASCKIWGQSFISH